MWFVGLFAVLWTGLVPAGVQAAAKPARSAHPTAAVAIEIDPVRMLLALRPAIAAAEAIDPAPPTAPTPTPVVPTPSSLPIEPAVQPYRLTATATGRRNEVECLAAAVHYEAANQGPDGQAAVAQVVLNRLNDARYPKTVCGVVFQGSTRTTGCQFTFTCDGSLSRKPALVAWRRAEVIAEQALDGYVMADVGAATHYHTVWVHPYWSPTLVKVATIGAHIFYRAPGARAPGALQIETTRVAVTRGPRGPRGRAAAEGFTAWGLSVTGPARPITTTAW